MNTYTPNSGDDQRSLDTNRRFQIADELAAWAKTLKNPEEVAGTLFVAMSVFNPTVALRTVIHTTLAIDGTILPSVETEMRLQSVNEALGGHCGETIH